MSKGNHKGAPAPEAAPAAVIEAEAAPAAEAVPEAEADVVQLRAEMQAEMERLELAFAERLEGFTRAFTSAINEIGQHVAAIEQRLAGEGSIAESPMVAEVQNIKASLGRVVDALGRQDLLTPQATAEQLEAALAKGKCRVKVLADYSTLKFTVKAGRVLDSQSSDHRALLDGVRSGKLKLSLLPPE